MIQDYPLTALATAASAIATWVIGGIAGTSRYKYGVKGTRSGQITHNLKLLRPLGTLNMKRETVLT
jgi:hypothetical protein